MDQEEKINRLETEITHLEEYARELNTVVVKQGEMISLMQKQIKKLNDKIENDQEEINETKKPPHY
jgi:uncharacterized coiled-coil protein SlyX